MNAITTIEAAEAADISLTEIMERECIKSVTRFHPHWSVVLLDGRQASAPTVGEALAKAKLPTACNLRKLFA